MYKILGISSPIPHKWSVVLIAYSTIDAKQRLQLKNFYLIFFFFWFPECSYKTLLKTAVFYS